MKNAPSGTGKRIPPAPQPQYEVVWSGTTVSPWGERGSLLPPSHNVGSTWEPSVDRLRKKLDAINKRDLDAAK